ncbi:hypothetical protein D0Z00_002659 [Geotrichum galactomycetum]|uniref:Uncharacterized protein n=1 Tax=Geotrichum galactomycetum TaxID=27317 RepID=A0ACB6V3G9_9ASCO|nr:hypothetical protein D0Z00_002659 [Geotrichum candidum]
MVLSTWVTESFNAKLSTGFELSVSQFAVLQNVFEILSDFKALYVMIERVITITTNGSLLYFMANSTRDHLAIFAAIADVAQLIQLFVNQYKSLNVKTKMSKGLWDLINFALKEVPESNVQLRTELEQIVLPTGQTPLKDIITLSPMSDIVNESIVANQELGEFLQERLALLANSKLAPTAAAILNHSGSNSNGINSSNNNSSSAGIGNANPLTATTNSGGFMGDESDYLRDLILYNRTTKTYSNLNVRAFDLLEESNHTMQINDVALNLAMFDGFIEKKNPV